jgi:hypothetical protein
MTTGGVRAPARRATTFPASSVSISERPQSRTAERSNLPALVLFSSRSGDLRHGDLRAQDRVIARG